ncbi:MAG: MgtC/SapB family protein [Planctomycetota bacterium]
MLAYSDLALRIGLALAAGIVVGLERESHGRAAGLRTTVLVCVAATMAMILSEDLMAIYGGTGEGRWRPDPARLGAGVLTGIGFLGAGSIIRHGDVVRGVTTAATLWLCTVIGLSFGAGYIVLGLIGLGVAIITLFVLPYVEGWVKNDWYATVSVDVNLDGPSEEELRRTLLNVGVKVKSMDLEYDLEHKKKIVRYDLKFKKTDLIEISRNAVHQLIQKPGVNNVKWM